MNRARPMAARLKKKHGLTMNRARPMAGRLKKKPRVNHEPRSAHGPAVKKYRTSWG